MANGTVRQLVVSHDLLVQIFTTVRVVASLGPAAGAALGGIVATWAGTHMGLAAGEAPALISALIVAGMVRRDKRVVNGDITVISA